MTSAPARFTPAASAATRSSDAVAAGGEIVDLYLHRGERRPQFVRGVGEKALLRFDRRPQPLDKPVHARHERRHFRGNAVKRDRLRRHGAARRDFGRQLIQPPEHAVHRPSDDEPGERDHDQDRRGGPDAPRSR